MSEDPLAPKLNANTLKSIMGGFKERNGHRQKKRKSDVFSEPNRFCKVCQKTWFKSGILVDPHLKPDICETCQKEIDKGQIAVTCLDGRHAFVYSNSLVGHGPVIEVSKATMDELEKHPKEEKPPKRT